MLDNGVNDKVNAVYSYMGAVFAAGKFTTAGGIVANRIAMWNGANWSALGTGIGGASEVFALCGNSSELIVGGHFNSAGGVVANNIARYGTLTSVSSTGGNLPSEYKLYQNYPNPFNPSTLIRFDMPEQSEASVKVFDINGKLVNTLYEGQLNAGSYSINWNASGIASGVYFYNIETGKFSRTMKMILMK